MDHEDQQDGDGLTTEQQLESTQAELAEAQEKLKELDDKQAGLKSMRKEAGRSKEEAKTAEAQKTALEEQVAALNQRVEDREMASMNEVKESVLSHLCGDDEDLRKKVDYEFGLLNIETKTGNDLRAKYEKAYGMATGRQPMVSPLSPGIPSVGAGFRPGVAPEKKFAVSEEGKVLARKIGMGYVQRLDAQK